MRRVIYNQSGYIGCSMSVRAVMAYDHGEKPKSKWTKRAMLDAIEEYCDRRGYRFDERFTKLTKAKLFHGYFEYTGWHHTGKYAQITNFYGLSEEMVDLACRERRAS